MTLSRSPPNQCGVGRHALELYLADLACRTLPTRTLRSARGSAKLRNFSLPELPPQTDLHDPLERVRAG